MSTAKSHSEIFKITDATSYDGVSGQFDAFTRTLSLPFVERMIRLATPGASDRILDVGTGTGIVAFNAARAVPKGAVIGVDLSEGMLGTARQNATATVSSGDVKFCRMDAEALEFEDGSFDIVLSLFALLHFPNPSKALAEVFRVLRPGGRLVLAVGGGPTPLSLATVGEALRHLQQFALQRTGKLLVAPAFLDSLVEKYLPGAIHAEVSHLGRAGLCRTSGVLSLVQKVGFANIQSSWLGHQANLRSAEDFWRIQSTFSSLARKRLAAGPQDKVTALREEFFGICRRVQTRRGRLIYPMGAFFVKAVKPRG